MSALEQELARIEALPPAEQVTAFRDLHERLVERLTPADQPER